MQRIIVYKIVRKAGEKRKNGRISGCIHVVLLGGGGGGMVLVGSSVSIIHFHPFSGICEHYYPIVSICL